MTGRQQFWAWHLGFPLLWALPVFWVMVYTDVDHRVSALFFDTQYRMFSPQWHDFLETVMHGYVQQMGNIEVGILGALLLISFWHAPLGLIRRRIIYLLVAMLSAAFAVALIKHYSNVYCPSDLQVFGGSKPFHWPFQVSIREARQQGLSPGQCWPAGHATNGFVLIALYFACRDRYRGWAYVLLGVAMAMGHGLGIGRVMQGAHFLTHQFWSALMCWMLSLFWYVLLLRRNLLPRWLRRQRVAPAP